MKVKEIFLTKDRIDGQTNYATGVYFVLENGDIYEAISTDVMEQTTLSKVKYEDLLDK